MTHLIVAVFLLVYLGMIFGGLPFVQLDHAGIALLGAIIAVAAALSAVFSNDIVTVYHSSPMSYAPSELTLSHE